MVSIAALDARAHDRDAFDCGVESLNSWLKEYANQSGKKGETLTKVALKDDGRTVVGYYAQKAYHLVGEELALAFSGFSKYPIPCVLIARLAVCLSAQGQGNGALLLAHALRSCVRVSEEIGVKFVVVHAKDEEAARFYEKFGFERFAEHPLHLLMSLKTVRKLVTT